MPLPIPDILERASRVLELAKKVTEQDYDKGCSEYTVELGEALKKVSPDDLLAVLNEIGKVYMGVNNIKILKIGSRPIPEAKTLEFAVEVEYGLGPRAIVVRLPLESATNLVKNFNDNLVSAATGNMTSPGGLILDAGAGNGQS